MQFSLGTCSVTIIIADWIVPAGKKSGENKKKIKVRELSGNFEIGQGNLKMKQKVGEKSGNF